MNKSTYSLVNIRTISLLLLLLFALPLFGLPAQETGDKPATEPENLRRDFATFQRSFIEIKRRYINEKSGSELLQSALKGMVQELGDPYSTYMSNETAERMKSSLDDSRSDLTGIGVQMGYEDEHLKVIAPIEGSPAWKAGVRPGDIITHVDGEPIEDIDDAVSRITGEQGTEVEITLSRPEVSAPLNFNLIREPIAFVNVQKEVLTSSIGYIRLVTFSTNSASEIYEAMKFLEVAGCRAVILDLRNNPGGLLDAAVNICDIFLQPKLLITYTLPRDEADKRQWHSTEGSPYSELPLVVLVNRGSASASEIVTGAMKDHGRAVIIGEKTFGKGSVQEIVDLPDGSALKLTIARYYTPSGVCIHGKGIEPDIVVHKEGDHNGSGEKKSNALLEQLNERWKFSDKIYQALESDDYILQGIKKLTEQLDS